VGDFPVTNVAELGNNQQCAEVENLFNLGGSGYYDCGLWGTYLIMDKVRPGGNNTLGYLNIMEIKAWSWDHLN